MTRRPPATRAPASRELTGARLPPRLCDLEDPPDTLWLRGELPAGPAVAVVGTRHPTAQGREFALRLVRDLARRGVIILSGGAVGIDRAAHEAALEAAGQTVVIAPASFERPYPEQHAPLFQRVLSSGGGYLSVVPDGNVAEPWGFFRRNSVMAALAHVVVAVESTVRSGTRNTTARARKLGRPVFWPPASPWDKKRGGFGAEYRLGGVTPLFDARDVLRCLEAQRLHGLPGDAAAQLDLESLWDLAEPGAAISPPNAVADASLVGGEVPMESVVRPLSRAAGGPRPGPSRVLGALAAGPRSGSELVEALAWSRDEVERVLVQLTLEGRVERDRHGRFRLL
ncbi:MAG: DNA-processing protein DprA [Myxococcales bacterium]|nr:DNA-processing protein DprA [Myxococcales bacterium]